MTRGPIKILPHLAAITSRINWRGALSNKSFSKFYKIEKKHKYIPRMNNYFKTRLVTLNHYFKINHNYLALKYK